MANQEWESKMNELRDAQLATQQMLFKLAERHDNDLTLLRDSQIVSQRLFEQIEITVKEMGENNILLQNRVNEIGENTIRLQNQVQSHENGIQAHQVDIAELRAMMASLITNIDRFIQGGQSNGH